MPSPASDDPPKAVDRPGPDRPTWRWNETRRDWENSAASTQIVAAGMCESMEYDAGMGFQITTTRHFSAAHQPKLYDGSLETLHGPNWRVKVTVSAAKLDGIGTVMDFHDLERRLGKVFNPVADRMLKATAP